MKYYFTKIHLRQTVHCKNFLCQTNCKIHNQMNQIGYLHSQMIAVPLYDQNQVHQFFFFVYFLLRQISGAQCSVSDLSFLVQFLLFIFKAMGKFIRSYNVSNLLLFNIIVRMLNPLLTAKFEPDRQHINPPVSIYVWKLLVFNLVQYVFPQHTRFFTRKI